MSVNRSPPAGSCPTARSCCELDRAEAADGRREPATGSSASATRFHDAVARGFDEAAERYPRPDRRVSACGQPREVAAAGARAGAGMSAVSTACPTARGREPAGGGAGPTRPCLPVRGPVGRGKRAVRRGFAAELLAADLHRVQTSGTHPDLFVLEPDGRGHPDGRRAPAAPRPALRPFEAERRIYLILDAHLLRDDSANALLKSLEDPPEYVRVRARLRPRPADASDHPLAGGDDPLPAVHAAQLEAEVGDATAARAALGSLTRAASWHLIPRPQSGACSTGGWRPPARPIPASTPRRLPPPCWRRRLGGPSVSRRWWPSSSPRCCSRSTIPNRSGHCENGSKSGVSAPRAGRSGTSCGWPWTRLGFGIAIAWPRRLARRTPC